MSIWLFSSIALVANLARRRTSRSQHALRKVYVKNVWNTCNLKQTKVRGKYRNAENRRVHPNSDGKHVWIIAMTAQLATAAQLFISWPEVCVHYPSRPTLPSGYAWAHGLCLTSCQECHVRLVTTHGVVCVTFRRWVKARHVGGL